MLAPKLIPLVLKQVVRHRTRSVLTLAGVGTAMFLFGTIQSIQSGLRAATEKNAADTLLIVYRKDRFCPFTSKLPEDYRAKIAKLDGVASATPMIVAVSNCRTSLDVVTFRGVPAREAAPELAKRMRVVAGSIDDWLRRSDAALVGSVLANRRGMKVGDRVDVQGITVTVAGIVDSDEPQDKNVAYVDLAFLQRAPGQKVGVVTQFTVQVTDPSRLDAVARAIDDEFAPATAPTHTSSEKAHVAMAAGDLLELVKFTRWVALGCAVAVLGLVANSIIIGVQSRVREHATLQALGFSGHLIARLIVAEGLVVSALGGIAGTLGALVLLRYGNFSLSNEGLSINFETGPEVWAAGFGVSLALGVVAGLVPAVQAGRRSITDALRSG